MVGGNFFLASFHYLFTSTLSLVADWPSALDDGDAIQSALEEISSQRTVPNIFINHQHVGGNSDLQAKKGQLPGLLQEAGAV